MKKYFLDTNILIDFLAERSAFGVHALQIFKKARLGEWELWTSDNAVTTTYYVIQQSIGEQAAREKLAKLLRYIDVQSISKEDLENALYSKFKDYEDAVQHNCALKITRLDGIITRNTKDFALSALPVFAPYEVLFPENLAP
ncbi:MAG: type II toxin-antitoxin system VapC family toxin [Cryomorphaceae bacterium]